MAPRSGLIRNWTSASLNIPNGSSLSGSLIIAGTPLVSIVAPVAWTAASISFDVSACEGGTFYPLYDDNGTQIAVPVTACTAIAPNVKLDKLSSWYAMRIRSGCGAASTTDQGGARTFAIFMQG